MVIKMEKILEIFRALPVNAKGYVYLLLPKIAMQWIDDAKNAKLILANDEGKHIIILEVD